MSVFTRTYQRLRRVNTYLGDFPQRIAARELNDASRWPEIVRINQLSPPYITDDPDAVMPGVILAGTPLQVPDDGSSVSSTAAADPAAIFGIDIALVGGRLVDDGNGDFLTVSGVANLKQALANRLNTPLRNLLFHLGYGNPAQSLKGMGNGPTVGLMANAGVQQCVRADNRIASTKNFTVTIKGDSLSVTGQAVTVNGVPVDVTN